MDSALSQVGRADLHIHTLASDGLSTVDEVMRQASKIRGLDCIAITDHNTVESAYRAQELAHESGVEVIIGSEVSSQAGHILGLWIQDDVKPGMSPQDTVDAIHAQGGIAVIAHPYANKAFGKFGLESVGDRFHGVDADGIEVYNSTPYMIYANVLARRISITHPQYAAIGGSDAHIPQAIGKGITLFPGKTASDLRKAIEQRRTEGVRGFVSRSLVLRYLKSIPSIARQQGRNLERCKPTEISFDAECEKRTRPSDKEIHVRPD